METIQTKKFNFPRSKTYFWPSFIISLVLILGLNAFLLFVPEYMFGPNQWFGFKYLNGNSYFNVFNNLFIINNPNRFTYVVGWLNWSFYILENLVFLVFGWFAVRAVIMFYTYPKWYQNYLSEHTKIINSCPNANSLNLKVAMVVPTCNDFLPNTIIQTASQTYKNLDVWISDDSSNPEVIKKIDDFCKEHGYHVLHRDPAHKKAHPTKVGNVYYWLEKYGDQYDYIFENDSSSIITSTFVENCMCYFTSPLYDHSKDGGIICNGSFYGSQNLISYINSKTLQFTESHICGGGAANMLGHPVMLNGWGAMYKISTLKFIPLEEVECPICDSARGLWLTKHGYHNYLNPFDFSGKFGPQNIEGLKSQKLKWNGGDIFIFRTGLVRGKYPNVLTSTFVKYFAYQIDILIPLMFIVLIGRVFCISVLNFFYINFSALLTLMCFLVIVLVVLLIIGSIKKVNLTILIFMLISGVVEQAIYYRRVYQIIIRGYIKHTWSSGAVTVKTVHETTAKQKIRMSIRDLVILLIGLGIGFFLQFAVPAITKACGVDYAMNFMIIWFVIFPTIAMPSILYLVLVWVGEFKVQNGYDDKMVTYPIEKTDFRWKYVRETEVWKRQHPDSLI